MPKMYRWKGKIVTKKVYEKRLQIKSLGERKKNSSTRHKNVPAPALEESEVRKYAVLENVSIEDEEHSKIEHKMDGKRRQGRSIGLTSEEDMRMAVDLVIDDRMTIREVSRITRVKRSTLRRYVQKKKDNKDSADIRYTPHYDAAKAFTTEQEISFVKYLRNFIRKSHKLEPLSIRLMAFQFAEKNNISMPSSWKIHKIAGKVWLASFLKRNNLNIQKTEVSSLPVITPFEPINNKHFSDNIKNILSDYPTIRESQGSRIYNLDELEITITEDESGEISKTRFKLLSNSKKGKSVTTCCIISASGTFLPPALVFPEENFKSNMIIGAPIGTLKLKNSSGLMTEDLFLQVLDHFVKFSKSSEKNPSLLIYDNHKSHISMEIIQRARKSGVVLVTLTSDSKSKLQPLEIGVYKSFNSAYRKARNSWIIENPEIPMKLDDVGRLIIAAFRKSMTTANIVSGFRKSGIYPGTDSRKQAALKIKSELQGNEILGASEKLALKLSREMELVEEISKHALELIEASLANMSNPAVSLLHEEIINIKCSELKAKKIIEKLKSLSGGS